MLALLTAPSIWHDDMPYYSVVLQPKVFYVDLLSLFFEKRQFLNEILSLTEFGKAESKI